MFSLVQAAAKFVAVYQAYMASPGLIAAVEDFWEFIQSSSGGGAKPTMMAQLSASHLKANHPEHFAKMRSEFEKSHAVQSALAGVEPGHKGALNIGSLFDEFVTLLPQIIALWNLFKKKPATT